MSTEFHIGGIFLFLYRFIYFYVGKVGAFEFSRVSRRDRVGKNKALEFFISFSLGMRNVVSGEAFSIVKS